METLNIHQLKGYLGTGLKVRTRTIGKYSSIKTQDFDGQLLQYFVSGVFKDFKPYLLPRSSLTKEQLQEFSVCFRMWYDNPNFDYKLMIHSDIELCYKYHIDFQNLIEKGLAISVNSLDTNPYL